jgi:non-ribosomal peptide synthetase component F
MLTGDELAEIERGNDTAMDLGTPTTIDQLFAEQAARVPDRTAVASDDRSIPYAEVMRDPTSWRIVCARSV